jgi:HAD superfamily hydrolase (TIGR01509 family)
MAVDKECDAMNYDLIIFDCDGTLVDSEYLNNKAVADLLAELGLPQYDVAYALEHFAARTMKEVREIVLRDTGIVLPDSFSADFVARVQAVLPTELKIIEGVLETLQALHVRIPVCVASNGERSNVRTCLEIAGLTPFFPDACVFTKNMVKHPKPAPDLFLLAAQTMGADPSRTLVVEDSVTGTMAGKAAGMTVAGMTAAAHDPIAQGAALRAVGADYITHNFADIAGFLAVSAA